MASKRREDTEQDAATEVDVTDSLASIPIPPASCTVEERVLFIAKLMSVGAYRSYATRVELADAWGVAESTIRGYTAQAHRVVSLDPEERERMRVSLANYCMRLARKAETERSLVTGLPDIGNAIRGVELAGKYMGVEFDAKRAENPEPQRIEIKLLTDDGEDAKE